uniref:Dynein light intermediate chain n=1 Tax=Angiostrongylus cantonensis TaxID=6313 RepID=A0A158PAA7_ANGCA
MSETIGEKPKVEIESSTLKQTILVNGNELSDQAHDKNPLERVKDRVKDRQPIPVYISRPSMTVNSDALEKKATEPLPPGTITKTWRRHSAMDHVRETLRRESCQLPILVYTGGQDGLYARIRDSLSRLIPADRYTVFHLSPEAMKKQPWMEPSTACLVVADTSELDDQSWANMQLYFNQAGKIIFVCQNQLLASLTHCDSSKKQACFFFLLFFFFLLLCFFSANMIRMAFGSRDSISMGKDFEHFLKKSLKTLSKHGEINTKFHSKDFAGAMSYSVVFSKVKDMPLFLYMENSAHQASAIFSDATSEQLLSPGNKILPEALSRVGVEVVESTPPALTQAVMMASEDSIIENMMGVRYGEEIGQTPKLFFRRTERAIEQGMPEVSEKLLPVEVLSRNLDHPDIGFDFLLYFTCLQTRQLGHVIVYVPVATTTMDINERCIT